MSLKPKRVDFDETWCLLQETVQGVITLANVPRSTWNDRFSDVYSLCVAFPEPLADRLYTETKVFLDKHVKHLLEKVEQNGDSVLLKSYYEAWTQYSQGMNYLHRLYLYLNQQHIKKQKLSEAEIIYGNLTPEAQEQMEIGELGLEIWKVNMIDPLRVKLIAQILEGIHQDRIGISGQFSPSIIRGVIESFVLVQEYKKKNNLDLYEQIFEEPFLQASGEYFKKESNRLLLECNVSQYMEKVSQRLDEEGLRSTKFLHTSSYDKVRAKCEQYMVSKNLPILHGDCQEMVVQERRRELTLLYGLVKSVPGGLPPVVEEVLNHITQRGLRALPNNLPSGPAAPTNADPKDSPHVQFVESMLAVHAKYKQLIQEVFNGDQAFMGALDKACTSVINHKTNPKLPCRSPELLAKYCDSLLKKSSKGISESEIEEKLSQSITIFKYIDDKDVFQKFYARMLAKRLIHQQSQSMDAEEAMINRLKQACGYEFTNKLHRMFTDISLSADLNNKFNNYIRDHNFELGINFSIYVLQAGAWPLGQTALTSFAVPQELERSVQKFENFYHEQFNGRKLTWLHHLCQGELKLTYLKKPYLITMQTFQMAILLLFEKTDSLTGKDLQETLQLNSDQFAKHVASLVDCKLLISNTPTILPETVLSLNMEYSNKRTKLRISGALQRDSPQEVEHTMGLVDEDRKLYLHAAIVRIMKSRKLLRHNALIQEVLSQSRVSFAPSISMIKKCIEALIDKQYIARTPNSSDEYSYVA